MLFSFFFFFYTIKASESTCTPLFDDGITQVADAVVFKHNIYRGMQLEIDAELQTRRVTSRSDRLATAERVMYLAHGYSSTTSHSISMLDLVSYLGAIEYRGAEKSAVKEVTSLIGYKSAYTAVSDAPFHGMGPRGKEFLQIETAIQWYVRDMQIIKSRKPDKPFIVIARSGSTNIMLEIQRRHPDLIDALILVSPPEIFNTPLNNLLQNTLTLFGESGSGLNLSGLEFSYAVKRGLLDVAQTSPTLQIPALFLFGGKDPEVSLRDRQVHASTYQLQPLTGLANPGLAYLIFYEKSGHDVFRGNKEHDRKQTLKDLYKYLHDIGL